MVMTWKNGDVTRHELKEPKSMAEVVFNYVTPEKVTVLGIWTNYEENAV
jgi:hypothetical protein